MPSNIKVCVNGFVLSTLLFDCANNSGDQEGFLYGSVTRNVRREISDQSLTNTQEEVLISICSSVPCGSFLSFYDNVGHIKQEDLDFNLGDQKKKIIGWYRYRRYSAMYPSAREIVIHKDLRNLISSIPDSGVTHNYLVFAILSSSNLPNFATHSYDYAFFTQKRDNTFRPLNITILNLGDTRNSYRAGSLAMPFMDSASFTSVLETSWNFRSFYTIEDQIQHFHHKLRSKLESLQEELAASDAVNATLEDDIHRLSVEMQNLLASQEAFEASPSHATATALAAAISRESSATGSNSNEPPEKDLKRMADDPLADDGRPTKRSCPDKYFEHEATDQDVTQPVVTAPTEVSTQEGVSAVFAGSQLFDMDVDTSEASGSSLDKTSVKPAVDTDMRDVNLVPSPSSTVEVVISDSGVQSYYLESSGHEEIRSCVPDISNIKELSSEPPDLSLQELKSTMQLNVAAEVEIQSEVICSDVSDPVDTTVGGSTVPSPSAIIAERPASTTKDLLKKMTPPFIIYASKDAGQQFKDPAASGDVEESQVFPASKLQVLPDSPPISPPENVEPEASGSPTSATNGNLKRKEKGKGDTDTK